MTKQMLKLRLAAAGDEGLISFLMALMASGICDKAAMIEEVLDTSGAHLEPNVERLLREYRGVYWKEVARDTFRAIDHSMEPF